MDYDFSFYKKNNSQKQIYLISLYMKNKTNKIRKKHNKTLKCRFSNRTHLIKKLMELLNMIKLYFLNTNNYKNDATTNNMYKNLEKHVDTFVEIYLGKNNTRIKKWENQLSTIQYNRENSFKSKLLEYKEMLTDLNLCFDEKKDSDLLTIRDNIIDDINQFLYLLSFK